MGPVDGDKIVNATSPSITSQCIRVPVSDGHLAAVFVRFENKPTMEQILEDWKNFAGEPQRLELPSAPKQFIHYFTEPDRPQPSSGPAAGTWHGGFGDAVCVPTASMTISSSVCPTNTLRGAAGGAVLLAELLCAQNYI